MTWNAKLNPFLMILLTAVLSSCASHYVPPAGFEVGREDQESSISAVALSKPSVSDETDNTPAVTANTSRKIHYDGNVELLVSNARQTIKKIVGLVNSQKGYVERITDDSITVQVPAESFQAAYKEILTFGKVLQKVVTTVDITEEYRSTELRLKIAKTTRDRLMVLLAKAATEEDKLQLLKQIEAITATIQTLESQFELLKTKVNYSKITVHLKTYDQFDSRYRDYEPQGFEWINNLSPTDNTIARSGGKLEFKTPEGMLHIKDNKQYWLAESGDKAIFRSSKRANEPKGDGEFWVSAMKLRLAPKFKSVESIAVGDYKLLRLQSYDDVPSVYYVGIKVDKETLKLVELYFPDVALEGKYKNNVFDSIRAGET